MGTLGERDIFFLKGFKMSTNRKTENKNSNYDDLVKVERKTGVKHELVDGIIYAMSGGSGKHSRICLKLQIALTNALNGCAVYTSDMLLEIDIKTAMNYYYPDASVKCTDIDDDKNFISNPDLVAEVLSPSTASYDRVKKLNDYLTIKNLKSYLILRQDRKEIEHWYMEEGKIQMEFFKENEIVKIRDWIEFPVNDVYDGILET